MAIKKYTNGGWSPTTYRRYGTETDTITSLPAQIIGDGQAITSCQIFGNTVQYGTPTTDAPVDVVGCGERTRNIYNTQETVWIENTLDDDGNPTGSTTSHYTGNFTAVKPNTLYYISKIAESTTSGHRIYYYDSNKNWIGRSVALAYNDYSFTTVSGCKYIQIQIGSTIVNTDNWMISEGLSQTSFEPYGYKLPPTVNGTEYPIYLGNVQTTRRIKKLVLTGEENWRLQSINSYGIANFNIETADIFNADFQNRCTHFVRQTASISYTKTQGFLIISPGTYRSLYIRIASTTADTSEKFKQWLAEQHSSGTPVVLYCALATPETTTLNEPLHKIGDYADTVSATNIPTTGTPENFDVGTTLKPSEVQLTYHGWHEHTDTKYTQGG